MPSDEAVKPAPAEAPGAGADLPVLLAGMATTAAALTAVYFINKTGFHPMGFLLWYVVPIGAVLVGALSGTGYYLAQRRLNLRVSRAMLVQIAVLSVFAYFGAHYLTYLDVRAGLPEDEAARISFLDYMRFVCENVTVRSMDSDSTPVELGKLGYGIILLELAGFSLGAMIPSLILRGSPYCEKCRQYLRKHGSYVLASRTVDGFKKMKRRQKKEVLEGILKEMREDAGEMAARIARSSRQEIVAALEKARVPRDKDALAAARLDLKVCPRCEAYHADVYLDHGTPTGERASTKTAEIDGPLPPQEAGAVAGEAGAGAEGEKKSEGEE